MSPDVVFPFRRPPPRPRARLFCLPFAGGSAALYRTWSEPLGDRIDVCPVELPGRGVRFDEAPIAEMAPLVDELVLAMRPLLDVPVLLFGHSMGGRIAFEIAKRLGDRAARLFVSASPAPDVVAPNPMAHLDDATFLRRIADKGGTPREILEDADLMELVLPVLRADFTLVETYRATDEERVACPVTAFAGTGDREVPIESVRRWGRYTSGPFGVIEIPGDHFYLDAARGSLTREIARSLDALGGAR